MKNQINLKYVYTKNKPLEICLTALKQKGYPITYVNPKKSKK